MYSYGLIGKSLSHSFSQNYFIEKFERENIKAAYNLYEIQNINELNLLFKNNPSLKGLNVTIPYKQEVISFLTSISEEAKAIGAVNTIKLLHKDNRQIELKGYNTDVIGFRDSIVPLLSSHHTKALVLGSGGSSKAVCYVLHQLGIPFQIVSRKPASSNFMSYQQITPQILNEFYLIVNTTPLGMYPTIEGAPTIPYHHLTKKHFLYDLVYNPEHSLFLKLGEGRGAQIKNGLEMLLLQAEASWKIWNEE